VASDGSTLAEPVEDLSRPAPERIFWAINSLRDCGGGAGEAGVSAIGSEGVVDEVCDEGRVDTTVAVAKIASLLRTAAFTDDSRLFLTNALR
jgi:hypothetical protein